MIIQRSEPLLEVLRRDIAPGANDEILRYGIVVAQKLELDFHAGEITFMPFGDDYKLHVTVAGRRVIAQRTGRWRGVQGPEWCGPERDADGKVKAWLEVWDSDEPPSAARCLVYVKDWVVPANGTCPWREFARYYTKNGKEILMPTWERMSSHMLGLRAEALALRRGFPEIGRTLSAFELGYDDDEATMANEETGEVYTQPADPPAAPAGQLRPAGGSQRRSDRVPDYVYDDLPEARGYR